MKRAEYHIFFCKLLNALHCTQGPGGNSCMVKMDDVAAEVKLFIKNFLLFSLDDVVNLFPVKDLFL